MFTRDPSTEYSVDLYYRRVYQQHVYAAAGICRKTVRRKRKRSRCLYIIYVMYVYSTYTTRVCMNNATPRRRRVFGKQKKDGRRDVVVYATGSWWTKKNHDKRGAIWCRKRQRAVRHGRSTTDGIRVSEFLFFFFFFYVTNKRFLCVRAVPTAEVFARCNNEIIVI